MHRQITKYSLFAELFKYRSLIIALVSRQILSRYRGSFLGMFWSFLNPLFLMLIYTLVFKYYIRFEHVENYSIYLFCGLLPWISLSSGLIEATSSISGSGTLITKSMFPPQVLPVVSILTNIVHYLLSLVMLFIFLLFAGLPFSSTLLLLPFAVLLQTYLTYGIALILASLNVYYRDVQHLVANMFSLLFFLCPILYPIDVVPETFRFTIFLNPFALLIELYHGLILEASLPNWKDISYIFFSALLFCYIGKLIYQKNKERFSECL